MPLKFDRVMIKKPGEYFSKHGGHGERDTFPLEIKAAMKNMATSQYFRFTLPVVVPAVGAPGNIVDAKVTFCARGGGGIVVFLAEPFLNKLLLFLLCVCAGVFPIVARGGGQTRGHRRGQGAIPLPCPSLLLPHCNPVQPLTSHVPLPRQDVPTTDVEAIKRKLGTLEMGYVSGRELLGPSYSSATRTLLFFAWAYVTHTCLIEVRTRGLPDPSLPPRSLIQYSPHISLSLSLSLPLAAR